MANNTVASKENIVYPYLGSLSANEAELIFTNGKGFSDLSTPEQPIFVLMIGTPGSGKSTALARLPKLVGLDPDDAVNISLDSLIESLQPFREKTAAIASAMLADSGIESSNNASEELVSTIAGKTSGPYLSYMKAKKNNRPGMVGKPLPMSMNEIRYFLLEKALAQGKNIIYERTISDASKDTLRDEVFAKIAASGKPYKIYIVYTKIDDEELLKTRLRMRPLAMMKRNPPFFRGVPSSLAGKFIRNHEEYFQRFLLPKVEEGVQIVVVFWDGRNDMFIPPRLENAGNVKGGKRTRTRRNKKLHKSKKCKTRRS